MSRKTVLLVASAAMAALADVTSQQARAKQAELVGTHGVEEIGRRQRQAQRTRGQKKRLARAASNELVQAGAVTIDLGHIHPRRLRERVRRSLDAGLTVTEDTIACWRDGTCHLDGWPCRDMRTGQVRCDTSMCGRIR